MKSIFIFVSIIRERCLPPAPSKLVLYRTLHRKLQQSPPTNQLILFHSSFHRFMTSILQLRIVYMYTGSFNPAVSEVRTRRRNIAGSSYRPHIYVTIIPNTSATVVTKEYAAFQ